MNKGRRKISVALACVIAMTLLSSCGNSQQGEQTQGISSQLTSSIEELNKQPSLSEFVGNWEMESTYDTQQSGKQKFTYQLDIFEEGKMTLSSTSSHFYGVEFEDYKFSDSGELELVIPYPIPSQVIHVPVENKKDYQINLSLKPENNTLVGKATQGIWNSPATFENVSDTPKSYFESDVLTVEQIQEDLAVVFDILENKHPNAFYTQPKEVYEQKKLELLAKLDTLDKTSFFYEVSQFVAATMDSHTAVVMPNDISESAEKLPIKIEYFSGKWHITGTYSEYKQLLGKEITAINDIPVTEIFERVCTMRGYENEALKRRSFQTSFNDVGLLNFLGIADSGNVLLSVNENERVEIKTVKAKDYISENVITLVKDEKTPTAEQKDTNYFCQKLDDDIFYIQYNACMDGTPPLIEFGAEVEKQLSEHTYKKIIVDLRNNGGGNSNFINYFYKPIAETQKNGAKVYALISGRTFSAAFSNAIQLQKSGVTLVGQPTGGNMQQFTEVNFFDLPNSRIKGQFSTIFHNYDPTKPNDSLFPDVQIDHTIKAYINGIDEEIEYIKADK